MTQSDNIKEFLKYASPRLEYIDHCMEKQALSPKTILSAVTKFKALSPEKQKLYAGQLKQIDDALKGKKLTEKNVKSVLDKRRSDLKLEKSKVSRDWEPPSTSKPKVKSVKYEDLFDADKAGTDYLAHIKSLGNASKDARKPYIDEFKSRFLADPRVTQEAARRNITPDALFDEVAKHYASGFRGAPGANARGLRSLFDDATGGVYYNHTRRTLEPITDWAKEHPVATPLIAAGVTNIPTAGISYAIGSNSGEERGVANADAYYRLLMAQQASALQNANGDLLSRLANVFGAGDLNKIIDGYYN